LPLLGLFRLGLQGYVWPVVFLLAALGSAGTWAALVVADRAAVLDASRRHLAATARLLEAHAERALEASDKVVQAAGSAAMRNGTEPGRPRRLHEQLALLVAGSPQTGSAWVTDQNGFIVAENGTHPPLSQVSLAHRGYFQAHQRGDRGPYIGLVIIGPASAGPRFTISRALLDANGRFAGVAAAGVSSEYFANIYAEARLGQGARFALLRSGGEPLASWPPEPADDNAADAMLRAERRLPAYPALVVVSQPVADALAAWHRRTAISGAAVAMLLIVLAGLSLLGLRAAQRERLLRDALEAERTSLRDRVAAGREALAGSETRLRMAQEAGGIGSWDWDVRTHALTWSESCHRVHGTDPAQPVTFEGWIANIHPADQNTVRHALTAAMAGSNALWDVEFRFIRPSDGALRWLVGRGSVLRDQKTGEALRVLGAAIDVTERRAAEERQALLSREVDHRAKNVLAVVQAALRLTPRTGMDSYAEAVGGRIAALARAHTLLAEGGWTGADLHALLRGELKPFLTGQRADLSGPRVALSADMAQPLAMAVHELATNAVKHGALAQPDGRLAVTWERDEAARRLRLRWVETGPRPIPAAPTSRGFGTRVLDGTVRGQLRGRILLDWTATGLVALIDIPMPASGQAEGVSHLAERVAAG